MLVLICQKNNVRGKDGKPPLQLQECMEVANKVLAANKITPFQALFTGDPYAGLRPGEMKKKNQRIEDLEKEVRSLKLQLSMTDKRCPELGLLDCLKVSFIGALVMDSPLLVMLEEQERLGEAERVSLFCSLAC